MKHDITPSEELGSSIGLFIVVFGVGSMYGLLFAAFARCINDRFPIVAEWTYWEFFALYMVAVHAPIGVILRALVASVGESPKEKNERATR